MTGLLFNFKDLAVLMSAFIATLIGLFFLRSSAGSPYTNKVLALFLFVQSGASALSIFLYSPPFVVKFDPMVKIFFLMTEGTLILLEGFLLYWYTKTLLFKDFAWGKEIYAHAALFLALVAFGSLPMNPTDADSLVDLAVVTSGEGRLLIVYALLHLTRVMYAGLCFINITRYRRLLEDKYSNTDKLDLSWLKLLIGSYLVARIGWTLIPISIVIWHYSGHVVAPIGTVAPYYSSIFDGIWLFTLSATLYFALHYSPRFEGLKEKTNFSSGEKSSVKEEHARRIEDYMRMHKPYLAMDLKLDDLAGKVSLPPKTLSILLNVHYKRNFCEFINQYRIKEATSILSDPRLKDKVILDIAMESGFQSKSAFNRAFKKETGVTPLEYRQTTIATPSQNS